MNDKIQYLNWMVNHLPKDNNNFSLEDGKRDRWIGFIQGVLWCYELTTIEELRKETKRGNAIDHMKTIINKIII